MSAGGAGMALAILAAFGFSFKAIFVKLAYPYGVDAITLLTLRMVFALPVFMWVGLTASRGMPALTAPPCRCSPSPRQSGGSAARASRWSACSGRSPPSASPSGCWASHFRLPRSSGLPW